jgi:hypothetical protein
MTLCTATIARMRIASILVAAVVLSMASCSSSRPAAQDASLAADSARPIADHVRLVHRRIGDADPGRWIVQTSVRTLRHPESGVSVTLLSMQHVAEADYYRGLTVHLLDVDVVLAEGASGQLPGKRVRDDQLPEEGHWLRRQQQVVARLLDLELQAQWGERVVDGRWILADMDTKQMVEAMESHKVEILDADAKARVERLEALMDGSPSPEELAEARAAIEGAILHSIDENSDPTGTERTVHELREEVMWRVVRERLASRKDRRIAVVYGAWHIPHLESKLVNELGFRLEATCWHDCVAFEQRPEAGDAKP